MADISSAKVREVISDFFSVIPGAAGDDLLKKVVLVDDSYSPISRDELLALARGNLLKAPPGAPTTQITDCDDYALQLKAAANMVYRQRYFDGKAQPLPPAVAIVISQNHAVNFFIEQDSQGKNSLWFIDASAPALPPTNDPVQAAQMMRKPPVKFIQM